MPCFSGFFKEKINIRKIKHAIFKEPGQSEKNNIPSSPPLWND
jgi:hypothetical protein